ncbi:MAG TPA: hypothetical protein VEM95_06410, partial [Thermoplasmata archaeon]|nr:hypothetical protein [Thermoplasmata archaeon]
MLEPTNPNGSGRAARPPGLTNGNGAFPSRNGRSPPNRGPAFTNGLGFVNGTRTNNHASPPPTVREVRRRRRTWKTWLPLFAAILLLAVPIAYFLTPPAEPRSVIRIDGSSSDWEHLGVPFYTDVTDSSNPDVALTAYAATRADGSLFLAARTAGTWFSDPTHASAVYFFVDTDGNASTGYRVDDLGADAQVRVLGQNGSAEGGRLTTWSGSDP